MIASSLSLLARTPEAREPLRVGHHRPVCSSFATFSHHADDRLAGYVVCSGADRGVIRRRRDATAARLSRVTARVSPPRSRPCCKPKRNGLGPHAKWHKRGTVGFGGALTSVSGVGGGNRPRRHHIMAEGKLHAPDTRQMASAPKFPCEYVTGDGPSPHGDQGTREQNLSGSPGIDHITLFRIF